MSLFICPNCGRGLERLENCWRCPNGHSFDRAREGYVHLLPANRMHSKNPGDDKGMAQARSRFLEGGYYAHLRDTLCRLACSYTGETVRLLDSGCGEGYYTAGVCAALEQAGKRVWAAGVDLSKAALKKAGRRAPEAEFAVASVYHLPVGTGSIDLLLNCFSPLALEEFLRVLRPGGIYLYVVPAPDHLWELKKVLYRSPYLNPEEQIPYAGFSYLEVAKAERTVTVTGREALHDLFQMTPYYWKTPKEGARRLEELDCLTLRANFRVHVFRKV